jgi:hypothetical protein
MVLPMDIGGIRAWLWSDDGRLLFSKFTSLFRHFGSFEGNTLICLLSSTSTLTHSNYYITATLEMKTSQKLTPISVVAISGTHSHYSKLRMDHLSGDLLLHTGDLTQHGTKEELQSAIKWLGSLPFTHKVLVAGNHDIGLDKNCGYRSNLARRFGTYATPDETDELIASMFDHNIQYLSPDSPSCKVCIDGNFLRIYGLPYSPRYVGPSAFMRSRADKTWGDLNPELGYDILLSHAPPRGHLDLTRWGSNVGCDRFLQAIEEFRPAVAVFGHINESGGSETLTWDDGKSTTLFNAAVIGGDRTSAVPTAFTLAIEGTL